MYLYRSSPPIASFVFLFSAHGACAAVATAAVVVAATDDDDGDGCGGFGGGAGGLAMLKYPHLFSIDPLYFFLWEFSCISA